MNKKLVSYSVSNVDIEKYLGQGHIIKYADLVNFNTIDDIFGDYNFVIVLIESKPNSGHWCCMLRYDNTIEMFDSYGGTIDHELSFISKKMKDKLGENRNILTELLNKSGHKVVVNKYKMQSEQNHVDTCGKFVLLRIIMFLCANMQLKEFVNFVKTNAKKLKLSNDEFVCKCITF